jgi:hypothetical protein
MGLFDDIKRKVDDTVDNVEETAGDVGEAVGDVVQGGQEAVDEVSKGTGDVVDEISEGDVGGTIDEAQKTAGKVEETVQETVGNVVSGDKDSGRDTFSGEPNPPQNNRNRDPRKPSHSSSDSDPISPTNNKNSDGGNAENRKDNTGKPDKRSTGSSESTRSSPNTLGNRGGKNQENKDKAPSDLKKQSDWFAGTNEEAVQELFRRKVKSNTEQIENTFSGDYKPQKDSSGPTGNNKELNSTEELQQMIVGDENIQTDQELKEKANITGSEELVIDTMALNTAVNQKIEESSLEDKAQKVENLSPIDVPYFDLSKATEGFAKQATDSILAGSALVAQTGKSLAPLDPTKGSVYVKESDGTMKLKTENLKAPDVKESIKRISATDDLTMKGVSMFGEQIKNNPEKAVNQEIAPEIAGLMIGSASVTPSISTSTTKTPSNVNVQVKESYLPDIESAKGETLTQSRIKQGAGVRNKGSETSSGRSVSKKTGDKVQTKSEQPSLYGKAEYQINGKTKTEDFIGQIKSSSETQTSSKGQGTSKPFESQEFSFESEGAASIDLTKVGEDGKVGGEVVEDAGKQIVDSKSQGQGQIDPLMYEASPEGGLKVGFESEQVEVGRSGGESFRSETKSTGVKDLENDVTKKNTKTRTSSSRGRGKTSNKDLTIDSDNLPNANKVRKQKYGNSDSSSSKDFKDLKEGKDVDPTDSSALEEMMDGSDSSTSESGDSSSGSLTDSGNNFDKSNYDGAGESSLVQKNPDQNTQNSGVDPKDAVDTSPRDAQSFQKAIKDKVSNKEIEVTKETNLVGRGVDTNQELDLDQGMDLDQDLGQGQGKDQEHDNPPVEDEVNIQDSTLTGSSTSTPGTSSSFSFSTSTSTPGKAKTPDLDIGPESKDGESLFEEEIMKGEKGREYSASLDALILGIKGGKKEYDLGTRPVVQDKGRRKKDKDILELKSKDIDL